MAQWSEPMTVREMAQRHGESVGRPQFVGTPETVADQLEAFFDHVGGDCRPSIASTPSKSSSISWSPNCNGAAASAPPTPA